MTKTTERRLPLFYRDPQLLTAALHGDLRLGAGNYGFARDTNAVPMAIIEFAAAMCRYPIVFSEKDGFPLGLLGLEQANRFVAHDDWAEGHYVPAYIRRYPFVFADMGKDSFALALDMGADRVSRGGEGAALFDEGKPTALTQEAMAFCREFHGAHIQTRAFIDGLQGQDLLVPQSADARLPSGRPMTLSGFTVVDRGRFEALDDAVILDWHKKGWLALIHFHFASLDRFAGLLARESDVTLPSHDAITDTLDPALAAE